MSTQEGKGAHRRGDQTEAGAISFVEDGSSDESPMLRGQGGGHRLERGGLNPMVVEARAKEHRRRRNPAAKTFDGGGVFDGIQ